MTTTPAAQDAKARAKRKLRDSAALLPMLGVILLLTPLVSVFSQNTRLGGIPNAVFYIFGVWLMLIGLTRLLAARLKTEVPD